MLGRFKVVAKRQHVSNDSTECRIEVARVVKK